MPRNGLQRGCHDRHSTKRGTLESEGGILKEKRTGEDQRQGLEEQADMSRGHEPDGPGALVGDDNALMRSSKFSLISRRPAGEGSRTAVRRSAAHASARSRTLWYRWHSSIDMKYRPACRRRRTFDRHFGIKDSKASSCCRMCNSADLVVDEVKGSNAGQRLIRVGATPPAT